MLTCTHKTVSPVAAPPSYFAMEGPTSQDIDNAAEKRYKKQVDAFEKDADRLLRTRMCLFSSYWELKEEHDQVQALLDAANLTGDFEKVDELNTRLGKLGREMILIRNDEARVYEKSQDVMEKLVRFKQINPDGRHYKN